MSAPRTVPRSGVTCAWLLVALIAPTVCGCFGYHVGSRTMFPANIRTVHVPIFESDSVRRGLGEWLTEAVIKEIELRPGYKVVGRGRADSVLEGRLISDTRRVVAEEPFDNPREYTQRMIVQVRWLGNNGQPLIPIATLQVPDAITEIQSLNNFVPETGQSVVSTQQNAIQQLAQQIVATMEVPW